MDKEASIEFILDSILRAAGETLGLRAHQLGRGRAIAGLGIDPEDLPAFAAEIRDAFGAEIPEGWLFREGHTFGDLAGEIFRQASSGKPPCGGSPARAAAPAAPPAPAGPPVPSEGVHRAAREAARAQLTRAGDAAAGAPHGFPPPPDGGGGPAPGENPLEVLGQQMKALYDVFAAQWSRLAGGAAAPPPPSPPPAGPASGPPPAPG
ncbi:MAG: hypothetical protein LBG06_12060, partial [Deltaproteobacteria bacterium]|nr:hypothetical protein [Deltaproteobacteria bacterium]